MYALVEWTLEGKFSIISLSAIVSPRKEYELYSCEENVSAKFQGKTYPARIKKISGNKKELEEELLKPVAESQTPSPELKRSSQPNISSAKRGDHGQKKSSGLKRKGGTSQDERAKKQPAKTVDISDINEEDVEARVAEFFCLGKEMPQVTPSEATQVSPKLPRALAIPAISSKKIFKSPKYIEETESDESETEEALVLTEMTPVPVAAKCPRQTVELCDKEACRKLREEIRLLKERLGTTEAQCRRLKRTCQELQQNNLNDPVTEPTQVTNKIKPGIISDRNLAREHRMVELVRGSFVFLYEDQLKISTESAKTMTGLARLLVDVFFTRKVQSKSNLSGENGLLKLDPVIVNAIITYCIACDQFKRQSPSEIKQALRNKLGCLRAPSRQGK